MIPKYEVTYEKCKNYFTLFMSVSACQKKPDMPGVKAKDLNIALREDVLALNGYVNDPEWPKELDVIREYRMGKYQRQFTPSHAID